MDKKIFKSVAVQMIGAVASCLDVYGYNPIGIGVFSAIMTGRLIKWPTLIVMMGSMLFFWDFLDAVKYGIVMSGIIMLIFIAKDKNEKVNQITGAVIGAGLYTVMEIMDRVMSGYNNINYGVIALVCVITFTSSMLMSKVMEMICVSGKKVAKLSGRRETTAIRDVVYEDKIKSIASSFERISKSITRMSYEDIEVSGGAVAVTQADVINGIWKGRMEESRNAIAMQLREMSNILKDCMISSYVFVDIGEDREKIIRQKLKNMGVSVKKIVSMNNRKGINEINITMKTGIRNNVTIRETENVISTCVGKKYRMMRNAGKVIRKEYATYSLIEEPNYFILHGVAKRGCEGQNVSGDNFSCVEFENGQTLLSVSDGMGHGIKAYKESEMVLSLLEELISGGFSEEASIRLINSVFMVDADEINPASVDMGIIDLYSGICDFLKIGAATTFLKRGGWIEAIKSGSMPIGSDINVDMESTSKKLYDGDYIIMMSDGIVENIKATDKEEAIGRLLMDIDVTTPQEMANEILRRVEKNIDCNKDDDMLVMVAGIWDKCA